MHYFGALLLIAYPNHLFRVPLLYLSFFRILVQEDKMTISELGSLGEAVGAFGLIVTIVFLAMESRFKRQSEDNRDLEQVQIRVQELNLAAATSPSLSAIKAMLNKLTGGHFQPLPDSMTTERMKETFDERELTMLVHYWYAAALGNEIFLTKAERGTISDASMQVYDKALKETTRYLTVLGNVTIPRRISERYLTKNG